MKNSRNMVLLAIITVFFISAGVVEPKNSASQIESTSVESHIMNEPARCEVYVNVIGVDFVALDSVTITMKDGRIIEQVENTPLRIGTYLEATILEMTISRPGYRSLPVSFTVKAGQDVYPVILHK